MFALQLEKIRLELWQLTGTQQRASVDQIGNVELGIAVLARVQVEHELRQRAMQSRDTAARHGEARAGNLRRGFEIEAAKLLAELDVVLRREVERARRAMFTDLDIGGFIAPVGHGGMQSVREAQLPGIELLLNLGDGRIAGRELTGQLLGAG